MRSSFRPWTAAEEGNFAIGGVPLTAAEIERGVPTVTTTPAELAEAAREGSFPAAAEAADSNAESRACARDSVTRTDSIASGTRMCVITDCGRRHKARGWCSRHYQAWQKHGDPLGRGGRTEQEDLDLFWSQVDVRGLHECWPWLGKKSSGHGYIWFRRRLRRAHQVSWELAFRQPFPEGMQGDHICHNEDLSCRRGDDCPHRGCVNPAHIKPRTPGDNTRASRQLFRRRQDWREWLESHDS